MKTEPMINRRCKECKHWQGDYTKPAYHSCSVIEAALDVEIDTGSYGNGGVVSHGETDENFGCVFWEPLHYYCEVYIPDLPTCTGCGWKPGGLPNGKVWCCCTQEATEEEWLAMQHGKSENDHD